MNEVLTVIAFFGPFWLTVISITVTVQVLSHWGKSRERELGSEMVRDMLARKMTVDEIERVLTAWAGRRAHLKRLVQEQVRQQAPLGKPVPIRA